MNPNHLDEQRTKLERRVALVRRGLPDDGTPLFVATYCNGCGRIEAADDSDQLLAKIVGWQLSERFGGNDYCPACRDTGEGWAGSFPKRRTA